MQPCDHKWHLFFFNVEKSYQAQIFERWWVYILWAWNKLCWFLLNWFWDLCGFSKWTKQQRRRLFVYFATAAASLQKLLAENTMTVG